jgi:hypothetical protein
MRASIPTRQLRSRRKRRVRSCSSRALPGGAVALQPDPLDAQRLHRLVVGGGAEAAVSHHRARWPAGHADDPLDGGHELGSVGRVALLELVVGDEAALVLGHEQGVAELGRVLGLALADWTGVGSDSDTSRSAITRLPASRWSV